MIKAIFFDIDGTLVPLFEPDGKIVPSTMDALHQLREKGIKVFIASGRPVNHLTIVSSQFDFDGYVAINGQYCTVGDKVLRNILMDKTHYLDAVEYAEKHQLTLSVSGPRFNAINFLTDRSREFLKRAEDFEPVDLRQYANEDIYFMMLFVDRKDEQPFLDIMPEVKCVRWNPLYCDVIPKNGGKDIGIQSVLDELGIDVSESMCFGDGGNDIPMLDYCGLSVAMGNADDEVKAHADYVTDDVRNDGVIKALKHFNII